MLRQLMNIKHSLGSLLCAISLVGFAMSAHAATATVAEVEAVIEQSVQTLQEARAAEHAWNITEVYLSDAREKLAAKELNSAMKAAQRALLTANKAVEQATAERSAWQARVPTL